jgi:uncharacterized protein YlxP (DUF503 family)
MIVGVLRISLLLRESHSLKDKRRVVKSLKDRVRARFNVSIAEVASQDFHQRADLAVVAVSGERAPLESVLDEVLKVASRVRGAEPFDVRREYF